MTDDGECSIGKTKGGWEQAAFVANDVHDTRKIYLTSVRQADFADAVFL